MYERSMWQMSLTIWYVMVTMTFQNFRFDGRAGKCQRHGIGARVLARSHGFVTMSCCSANLPKRLKSGNAVAIQLLNYRFCMIDYIVIGLFAVHLNNEWPFSERKPLSAMPSQFSSRICPECQAMLIT